MIIHPGVMGIDISKQMLDVFDAGVGRAERIANASSDIEELARRCAAADVFVVFEATGRYDALLRQALSSAGVRFARVNPAQARDFARAAGFLAKTDAVDARMLAAMAQCLRPVPHDAVPAERERLVLLHKRRDQLVATRQQERARRSECSNDEIATGLDRHLAWLDAEIKALERHIRDALAAQAELARLQLLLRSAPGIGPVSATTLIALLPELGHRSAKTIAALAGLAPFNRDSGRHRGQRSIGGGRKRVRDALYMAALTAARSRSPFRTVYERLRQAGKPAKLALIAVARKLLVTLNAMVRDDKAFQNN
jgi:transposase